MTSLFQFNTLAYGDEAGLGAWLIGHYLQHLAYNTHLAGLNPPIIIPDYNIIAIQGGPIGRKFWLDAHESWHEDVQQYANVTAVDFSEVDFTDPAQFYEWIDLHNQAHSAIDAAFGLA